MSTQPTLEFFEGLPESLSHVSLQRHRETGDRTLIFRFNELKALERFNSYTRPFNKSLRLSDEEGDISLTPSSVQIVYGGDDGDTLQQVKCRIDISREDHWQRLMRFMHRYAAAHGMDYGEP